MQTAKVTPYKVKTVHVFMKRKTDLEFQFLKKVKRMLYKDATGQVYMNWNGLRFVHFGIVEKKKDGYKLQTDKLAVYITR